MSVLAGLCRVINNSAWLHVSENPSLASGTTSAVRKSCVLSVSLSRSFSLPLSLSNYL